jgi:hypothetical protein
MTREQHEIQRAQVREVWDGTSGRMRLVRGDGEILERIVPRSVHSLINRGATAGDGRYFANQVLSRAAGLVSHEGGATNYSSARRQQQQQKSGRR